MGAGVRAKALDDFKAIGMTLKSFYIESLKPSDKSAEELRAMGMLDMDTYTQLQAADAMRDAAQNPSGGAGLTAGIGAGMGIGDAIADSIRKRGQTPEAAAAGMPDVMTPSEKMVVAASCSSRAGRGCQLYCFKAAAVHLPIPGHANDWPGHR